MILLILLYFVKPQSARGRFLNYLISLNIWKQFPFFGVGWKSFSHIYNQFQIEYFQHHLSSPFNFLANGLGIYYNEFLHIAVELGILGLVLFIAAISKTLSYEKINAAPLIVQSAWISSVGILTAGLFSYPFSQIYTLVIFIFNLVLLAQYNGGTFFVVGITKLRIIAFLMICGSLGMLFFEKTTLQSSLKWKKAYHLIRQNKQKGLKMYKVIYPRLKSYPTFLYNYGYELSIANEYSQSLKIFKKAQKNMCNVNILQQMGYVQMQQNYYKRAEKNYLKARYLVPSRLTPRYLFMLLYKEWNKPEKAKKMTEEILEMRPKVQSDKAIFIKKKAGQYLKDI